MTTGTTIVLNGTSGSGKTSIVNALQEVLEPPYLEAGIDKFLWMLPGRYLVEPLWHEVSDHIAPGGGTTIEPVVRAGPLADRLISGMHQAIAALAGAGNNVIVDHVLVTAKWLQECLDLFDQAHTLFVGVRCPLDVVERREREQGDRTLGPVGVQFDLVHAHGSYDFEVDTSVFSPLECAWQIKRRLQDGPPPRAFELLKKGHAQGSKSVSSKWNTPVT